MRTPPTAAGSGPSAGRSGPPGRCGGSGAGAPPSRRYAPHQRPRSSIPCPHLQIHAHRDAWTFLMCRHGEGSRRRAVSRQGAAGKTPAPPTSTSPSAAPGCVPLLRTSPRCSSTTRASTIPSAPWTRSQAHVPDGGEIRCAVVGAGQETVARVPRGAGGGSCQRRAAPRGAARPTGSRATGCHVRAGSLWAGWGLVGGVCSVLWCFGVVWAGLHCVLSVVSAIGPVADWVRGCVLWIWMWSSMSWLVPRAWLMGAGRRSPGWLWRPATAAPWVRRPWSVPRPRSPRCAPLRPGGPRPGRGAWPTACGGRGPCWPRPTSGPPTAPAPWPP